MSDEINDVYLKVDSLFKLKLKAQIKGSGLSFDGFLHVSDLVKERKYHLLIVNGQGICFNDLHDLYSGLNEIIKQELKDIEGEIDSCVHHKRNDLIRDSSFEYYQLEGLSDREYKLSKIIEQIKKIEDNKLNNNSTERI